MSPTPTYFDNHCHLSERLAGGIETCLDAARAAGVTGFITVGCDRATSIESIAVAEQHDDVWATVGLHPHDATEGVVSIRDLFGHSRVIAVGECGLDYHYDRSPRDVQRQVFAEQIELAHELQLPLVIHTREAWDDTFAILAVHGAPQSTIFHCFTGGPSEAERCLALGAYLSFSGIVTFKAADDLRAAARLTPPDRLLIETDSPYLAPIPHRGKPNVPAFVTDVAAGVAAARGESTEYVAEMTTRNTYIAFGLPGA